MKRMALAILVAVSLAGCAYVGTVAKQHYYSAQLRNAPRNRIYKHLLERDTFFVFGRVDADPSHPDASTAVLAISDTPSAGEVVDVSHFVRDESYFGLNLPAGDYRLLVVRDTNGDGFYTATEVTARRALHLELAQLPDKVLANFDIVRHEAAPAAPATPFRVAVKTTPGLRESLFYPRGTLRSLDDPIFAPSMAAMGLYEPAAFMEAAPMMFYALDEDLGYKIPVIFVHGIDGSARDFAEIVAHLDRRRYRAWFFHYPSGGDLSQLSAMFYEIFLSGNTVPHQDTPFVIVAHSMGGLIVRDALDRCRGTARENVVAGLITLASPLGGHAAAHRAAHAPVVIPSWRDLDPDGAFVRNLYRRPLPSNLTYHLFYTFGDPRNVKLGANSDGVIALESQLRPAAQNEARESRGFNTSHTGVLHDPDAIAHVIRAIAETKSPFPDDHLRVLDQGGYDLPLTADFTPLEAFLVRHLGHYMDAMVSGQIQPIHPDQKAFIDQCTGKSRPDLPAATAWLKLNRLRTARPAAP